MEAKPKAKTVAKKSMEAPMASGYDPEAVESGWYEWWVDQGFFEADPASGREPFVMVIPPPNVTGVLHIGHALTNSVEDAIVRWHRMSGREALWVPGVDHAGIATQVVVEKKLMRETGQTRHDIGREAFVEQVWDWKREKGDSIASQLRRLGSSLDWSREVFTMDETRSAAVWEAFVQLYEKGYIFRANRLVNWCCTLKTAISEIEVDHMDVEGRKWYTGPDGNRILVGLLTSFAYKVKDSDSDEEVVVATTRPETMLGDVAVAVHPNDERYKHLHGKELVHPFIADRRVVVITDAELVDMDFGTGAVKITPAHDPNDFACGQRKELPSVCILNDDGTLNAEAGPFAGMPRTLARGAVVDALKEKGLLRGAVNNKMSIGICSRSKDIVEPMLKPQWYVNLRDLAARAKQATEEGRLRICPDYFTINWYRWLENTTDWCISRQLWWGHRIPAWLCSKKGEPESPADDLNNWIVARTEAEALTIAAERMGVDPSQVVLKQDPDVLDTWFSSALFPFSVFGWPETTIDLERFFPTSLLETGLDILFFWVARMVMVSLALMDTLPFKEVFLHAMVRDVDGKKMSKSLGNVIDPIDVIQGCTLDNLSKQLDANTNIPQSEVARAKKNQKRMFPKGIPVCGTDAMRFALCNYTAQGRSINLDIDRVHGYRKYCNKVWNAVSYTLTSIGADYQAPAKVVKPTGLIQRWIMSRLCNAVALADEGWSQYQFANTTSAIYSFWWNEFCSIFLETSKSELQSDDAAVVQDTKDTLFNCVEVGLRLLSPFMPFVTEELWQRLPRREGDPVSICIATYPHPSVLNMVDKDLDADVDFMMSAVIAIRSLRDNYNITRKVANAATFLHCADQATLDRLSACEHVIRKLVYSDNLTLAVSSDTPPFSSMRVVDQHCTAFLGLKDLGLNVDAEIARLKKTRLRNQKMLAGLQKKVANPKYVERVPESVQAQDRERIVAVTAEIAVQDEGIAQFEAMKEDA